VRQAEKNMSKQNIFKYGIEQNKDKLDIAEFVHEARIPCQHKNCIECHCVYLVVGGIGEYITDSVQKIKFGTLFFSFKGVPFSILDSENLEYFRITFSGKRGDELLKRFCVNEANCVFHVFESLVPMWKEGVLRSKEATGDILSESVLLYTFSKLYPAINIHSDVFSDILGYVDENFSDPHLSLMSVAERFSYNTKYLSHVFKKRTGISFSKYLKNIRLKNAFFLIDQGVTSVKNISILTGYTDSLYFSKLFKEEVGVSPKTYINQKYVNE
jgi:AraC-like DNA-binding protein